MNEKGMRTCTKCEETLEPTAFYNDTWSHCVICERVAASARMNRYNKTLRGRANQALMTSRKTIKRNGYEVKDDLTLMDVIFTFAMSEGECSYCGKVTDDYHMEHIISLSAGGPNTLSNITVACKSCNSSKSNNELLAWRDFDEVAAVIEKVASRRGVPVSEVLEEMTPDE